MKKLFLLALIPLALAGCKKTALKPKTLSGGPATAPSITYPATNNLTVGTPVSISPVNSGGAIPATVYGQVTTFAGSATSDSGHVDGAGTAARFNSAQQMALDASGNLYVTDTFNETIRKIDPSGVVTTVAGKVGVTDFTDGQGTSATFFYPDGIAIDASGNIFIADWVNSAIRKMTPAGAVTTFYQAIGFSFGPAGISFDGSGNLLVSAYDGNQILKISPAGMATTVAGDPQWQVGFVDGTGSSALFNYPSDVVTDAAGNIYVADGFNNAVRKITPAGVVTTFAGSTAYQGANVYNNPGGFADGVGNAALFNNVTGFAMAPGDVLYVADRFNNDIRRIMPDATVTLVAGSATQAVGNADGVGTAAGFNWPDYITIDKNAGIGYISEWSGNRVRKIVLTGYSLTGILPAGLTFDPKTGTIGGTPTAATLSATYTVVGFNTNGYSSTAFTLTVN
ncbi:MAG TPA: SMP-30/gluconolactonase/LRE family protein [Mucilaginibacter sp.]|nr:SMP-30/gluconolactonase/LRE family protein [Mucilaginibacter sp.]